MTSDAGDDTRPLVVARSVAVGSILVISLTACAGENPDPSALEPPGNAAFAPCALFSDTGEGEAECAVFERPLLSAEPELGTIPIHVKRVRATASRRGQLFLLTGGPGQPLSGYEFGLDEFARRLPDLDVYVTEHRGTGDSGFLHCQHATRVECGDQLLEQWGDGLAGFNTTEAARDLAAVIRLTRAANDQVYVLGTSYGGYWLHRFLVLEPELANGAIFESSGRAMPEGGYAEWAKAPFEAGKHLLELCALDSECSARLGPDPYARAHEIRSNLHDCAALDHLDPEDFAQVLGSALEWGPLFRTVPALFYRAARCTGGDVAFVQRFLFAAAANQRGGDEPGYSQALNRHIFSSEIFGAFDEAALEEVRTSTLFNTADAIVSYHDDLQNWPRYEPDEYVNQWANVSIPVLVAHGGLDAVTPPSWGLAIADRVSPSARYVEFPTARHGVGWWPDGEQCGFDVMAQFLTDPEQPFELSCIDAAPPFAFEPDAEWLLETFGTDDLWGDQEP